MFDLERGNATEIQFGAARKSIFQGLPSLLQKLRRAGVLALKPYLFATNSRAK
jgi:hypothetical protein